MFVLVEILTERMLYMFDGDNKYCGTEKTYCDGEIDILKYPASQNHRTFIAPPSYDAVTETPVWNGASWDIHQLSEYITPEPTLDELKDNKRSEIALARYVAESAGCEWNGYTVATDRESRAILNTAKAVAEEMGALFTTSVWKMQSGQFVQITLSDMKNIGLAMASYAQGLFNKEAVLNDAITIAATKEEINNITWG